MLGFYKTWLRPDCRPDCDLTVTRMWPECRAMILQSGQRWTSQQQLKHTEDITLGAPCFSAPPRRSITWVMLLRNRVPGKSSIFSLRLCWSFLLSLNANTLTPVHSELLTLWGGSVGANDYPLLFSRLFLPSMDSNFLTLSPWPRRLEKRSVALALKARMT